MSTPTPQLVYIAAMSRSGSTLLDLLLDQHPQIASLGELHVLPHEAQGAYGALPCGCGVPVLECPVWSTVLAQTNPLAAEPPRLHHFRETHQWGPTFRWRFVRKGGDRSASSSDTATYLANTNVVVSAAADALGAISTPSPTIFVDASKDPYRVDWLVAAPNSTVKVIHLTRDPRAVINSLTRDQGGLRRAKTIIRRTSAWVLENALIARSLAPLPTERYVRLRYEDLARDPQKVLADLHEWLGLAPAQLGDVQTNQSHALAGNPMRRSSMNEIRLDERWRTELSKPLQLLVQLATRPAQRLLGDIYV